MCVPRKTTLPDLDRPEASGCGTSERITDQSTAMAGK